MNRLILVFLVCLTISYISCVDLTYFCKNDTFDFQEGYRNPQYRTVNSFYRLPLTNELPKVKYYMVNHLKKPDFLKDEELEKFRKAKSDSEKLLLAVYNENFASHVNKKESPVFDQAYGDYLVTKQTMKNILSFDKGYPEEEVENARKNFINKIDNFFWDIINVYMQAKRNFITFSLINRQVLLENLKSLDDKLTKNQVPSFNGIGSDRFPEIYYERQIMTFTGFKLDDKSNRKISPESKGTISFDIIVPFDDKNYDEVIEKVKCLKDKDTLPGFYVSKGLE